MESGQSASPDKGMEGLGFEIGWHYVEESEEKRVRVSGGKEPDPAKPPSIQDPPEVAGSHELGQEPKEGKELDNEEKLDAHAKMVDHGAKEPSIMVPQKEMD